MATSEQLKAVERLAEGYDEKLRADDPRFRRTVYVEHDDGSKLFYRYAFALQVGEFWCVFTEHHRFYVYDCEDACVTQYAELGIVESDLELGK